MCTLTFEPNEPQRAKRATARESILIGRARGRRWPRAIATPRPEHDTRAKWKDSCSATRRCAGYDSDPAAIKPGSSLLRRAGPAESPARSRRNSGTRSACEAAGRLLPSGRVRARPRQHPEGDVRALRHASRDAGGRWARQAASGLTRRSDDPTGGHAVSLRERAGEDRAGLWRLRRNGSDRRPSARALRRRRACCGKSSPSSSSCRVTRFARSPRSLGSPSRRLTATCRTSSLTPRRRRSNWPSRLGRWHSSRSTSPSRVFSSASRRATPARCSPSRGSTSGALSCCTSRKPRSNTPAQLEHRWPPMNAEP